MRAGGTRGCNRARSPGDPVRPPARHLRRGARQHPRRRGAAVLGVHAVSSSVGGSAAALRVLQAPERVRVPVAAPDPGPMPSLADLRFPGPTASPDLLPEPGEAAARARLDRWTSTGLSHYADRRDLLAVGGTSRLGQDLHLGSCAAEGPAAPCDRPGDRPGHRLGDGPRVYASELCWRDFYAHVLWHWPDAARRSFRPVYDAVPWRDDPEAFAAWTDGRTGYPVVDAAMRQLRATGWMPRNRARMIVASFLAKDLLVDFWRSGEADFMAHLVDGDLADDDELAVGGFDRDGRPALLPHLQPRGPGRAFRP